MPAADPVCPAPHPAGRTWPGDGAPVARHGRVVLRRLRPADLDDILGWNADPLLVDLYGGLPTDLALEDGGYVLGITVLDGTRSPGGEGAAEENAAGGSQPAGDRNGPPTPGRLVGLIGLTGETWGMGSAELRILIGNRSDWGRGYGREAIAAFLDHVLAASDLDFIFLRVFRRNTRAIRCYQAAGFRRSGRLRIRRDDRYSSPPPDDDLVLMTLTRASFLARGRGQPVLCPAPSRSGRREDTAADD